MTATIENYAVVLKLIEKKPNTKFRDTCNQNAHSIAYNKQKNQKL